MSTDHRPLPAPEIDGVGLPSARTTVVVATRNRREELLSTLSRHPGPVVVVDNASTDGTAEAVRRRRPDAVVHRLPKNLGAYARTVGARLASTPYVAFADDDSWWEPRSLERAERAFDEHPRLAVIAGSITVGESNPRPDPFNDVLAASPLPAEPDAAGPGLLGFVACGSVVRREAFLSVGGFDAVVRFPGEEARVALDLDDAGWQLAYLPQVAARHVPSPRRSDPATRARAIERSRLLTAVLRLPLPDVASELRRTLASGPGRRALLEALPRVPAALAHRHVVGTRTLQRRAATAATS